MPDRFAFEVERAGMMALVQDRGRPGYQQFGVPPGGFLDRRSAALANWLVGNPREAPVLEVALAGPQLRASGTCQIALAGADLSAHLDGSPVPLHTTVSVPHDAVLSFGKNNGGCRSYLAIGGQWLIEPWLGSVSATPYDPSLTPESDLRMVDRVHVKRSARIATRRFTAPLPFPTEHVVRILPGPEFHHFPAGAIAELTGRPFTTSSALNRMGIRLEEALTEAPAGLQVISSGIIPGTIQITHGGQPIVLLADAQTSGGYPRIANVISADLDILAQVVPGDTLHFKVVSQEAAVTAWRDYLRMLRFR